MSDDRQVRSALNQLLEREHQEDKSNVHSEVQYFELVSLTLEQGKDKAFWAWMLLCRQHVLFRDFLERGNAWYDGPTPAMTDRCFGRPCPGLSSLPYDRITKVVKDTNTPEHFKLELQNEDKDIYIKSANREPLLKHLRMWWQVDRMYKGSVAVLQDIDQRITKSSRVVPEVQPFWRTRWEAFQGYKFMVPEEFAAAPKLVRAGQAVKFSESDASQEHDASITICVHQTLTLERLRALKRDHIRWVAAGYKQSLIAHADNYHIGTYRQRKKRMNLTGDIAAWSLWEIHLTTRHEKLVCIVARRQFLPPLCNTAQDIGIIVRCPANDSANGAFLAHRAHLLADSLCPDAAGFQIYTDIVRAKLDALRYDEGGMEWIEAQLRKPPSHKRPDEQVKMGSWVRAVESINRVFQVLTKNYKPESGRAKGGSADVPTDESPDVPRGSIGRAMRFNAELRTWRIAWYLERKTTGERKSTNQGANPETKYQRVEMRLMEKTIALLEVIEEDKARDEYPLFKHILDFAKQNGHEDKVPLEKSAEGEDPSAANVVPAMSTGAKAFVAQLLKLYCESSNARRLLQKHQGQSVKELFGKDSTLDMQRAGLFQLMRDELQSPKLKKTAKQVMMKMKEEEKGAAGMAEFLNMFTVGKKLGELQIQTGLEEFNVDEDRPNDPERRGEKYQWDVNVEPLERDLEMCACCGSEIAQRCRDSETKSTDLQWCVSNHFQESKTSWHCYKYCFKCWKVRNEWTKRVANYFAWAVDGGLLGSRFPVPEDRSDYSEVEKTEPIRYGSLLDVMLETDVWNQVDNHKDLHVALYFMLHMRLTDSTRSYDSQLHVIELGEPDEDCNGLYAFCGLSKKVYGAPWFQKTTKKDAIIYLHREADGGRRAPWEGQLQGKGTSGSRAWWVLVKGRLDSPWEPHEEEELVAFIDAGKPTGEGKELAWPRHGRDEKWTWNRLQVTAVRHPPPHPHLIGVYAHTIDNCWQHTTRPRKGSAPRIAPGTRRGHDQEWTLLGGVEGKEGHPTKEFEIHVDCQPRKPVVFMYSDGEITLLYQKVQYIIMTKWEFNDRVMMMLLSKRYFNKVYFHHSHGEGALHDRDHAHKVQKEKADLADRVRCLGKLLDSNASLDLQAFVCKTVMGMMSGEVDEDLCTLALDSLVKLLKKNNLFIATYATAALVNLSKDRPVVKGILLGMHIADLCMKNLDTRDEDLMVYTLMLVAHLTKESGHRVVMIESGLVPKLYEMLLAAYAHFKPSPSNSRKITVKGFRNDAYNGSYTRALLDQDGPRYDIDTRYYRSDSNSDAVMYIYPKRAQNFLIVTTDLEENQYDDTNTVLVYALISRQEREAFEREGVLPQRKVAWTVLAIDKGKGHAATLTIDVLGAAGAGAQKADHAVTLRVTVDQGGQLKAKDAKGARGKKDEKDARSENRAKDSWQDTVEGDYVSMKKTEFVFEKKGLKRKEQVYIKALDGPRWWCIGNKLREMDPSCSVNHDYEVPQREYDAPSHPDVVAHNWIDTPDEEGYPPFDKWEMTKVDAFHETPRVTTHVLHSKEKLLVQLCIVIGQLANEEHYRALFLYHYMPIEYGSEVRENKHTMDCLLFMFHQVASIGDILNDVTFNKLKHQAPLSKVVFAMKQLCANDTEQKKKVGKSVIVPLVRCLHTCHPAKDKLLTELVFQSFTLLQMLSAVWENMQLLLSVHRGENESKLEDAKDLKKETSNYAVEALSRIKFADFHNTSIGQESWEAKVDMMIADIYAVHCRLKQS